MATAPRRLGPMGIADVMDETIRVYRVGFRTFVGAMALPLIPVLILLVPIGALLASTTGSFDNPSVDGVVGAVVLGVAAGLIYIVGIALSSSACVRIAADLQRGEPTSIRHGYTAALERFWALVGVGLLVVFGLIGLYLVWFIGAAILGYIFVTALGPIPAALLYMLALLLAAIGLVVWFAARENRRPWLKWFIVLVTPWGLPIYYSGLWALSFQALLLENLGPGEALRRSKQLVRGLWWRVFGTIFLIGLLVSILQAIPQVLFGAIALGAIATSVDIDSPAFGVFIQVVTNLGSAIGWVLFGSIQIIAINVLYQDARVRKEALDLELMADRIAAPGVAATGAVDLNKPS